MVGFSEAEFRTKVAKATTAQFAPKIEVAGDDEERLTLLVRMEQQTERNIETGLAARAWDFDLSAKLTLCEARSDRRVRKLIDKFTRFRDGRTRW